MWRALSAIVLLTCCAAAAADVIHLRDGRDVRGELKRHGPAGWVVYDADRRATFVTDAEVASIELAARPVTDRAVAAQRLESLRRSVVNLDDPARAAERFRRFIDNDGDAATLAAARQDLAVWQDRVDRHMTRLDGRWLSPAAREQATADSLATAGYARQLLKQGRDADAMPLVLAALAMDPRDASAHYLLGLLRFRQGQWSAARQSFEAVAAMVPEHTPTLNNLAVLDWRDRQYATALARYDAAMILAPQNPAVLANVRAALAGLANTAGRDAVVDRVARRYLDQSQRLAARMAQLGLQRFGTALLTDAELQQVRLSQRADAARLDDLAADFERAQDRVRQTDLAIVGVEQQMRQTSPGSGNVGPGLASDGDGQRSVGYYELRNDAVQLQQRRAGQVAELDAIKQQAAALRRQLSGQPADPAMQRLIGPEGTPLRVPDAAARRP